MLVLCARVVGFPDTAYAAGDASFSFSGPGKMNDGDVLFLLKSHASNINLTWWIFIMILMIAACQSGRVSSR